MTIYFNNTQIDLLSVDDNSYRYRAIKGENSLTLYYSLSQHIEIPIGAYCIFEGETYTLENPENFKKHNTRNFEYTLIMEAAQAKLKKYKFKDKTTRRLKFSLTAKPKEHLQMLVDNMNQREHGWTVGNCIDAVEKVISYNHAFCSDALSQIAEAFETEWEVVGKTIHLCKVEYNKNNPLPLSYGRGNGFKSGIGRTNGDKKPVEILFVQGGERNIDASRYGSRELLLPKNQTIGYDGEYFSDQTGYNAANARQYISDADGFSLRRSDKPLSSQAEDSLDCSHIYPSRVGKVSEVSVVDAEKHFYDIIDSSIPEDLNFVDYLIAGETMTIIFQSGMLTGKEFDVKYIHEDKRFEIVPVEIDGRIMPDEIFRPQAGEDYAVFGMMLPDAYICDNTTKTGASWDMFREAVKYKYENEEQKFTFSGELDGIWAKRDWTNIGRKIKLGSYVQFIDNQFQPEGVLIRIIGIKDYINNPHSPTIELSNEIVGSPITSDLRKIETNEVVIKDLHDEALQFTKRRFRDQTGNLFLAILKTTDSEIPSDFNVFSSLRTINAISDAIRRLEFSVFEKYLRKDVQDEAEEQITFKKGLLSLDTIRSGLFQEGFYEGFGWSIEADGKAWLKDINLRGDLWGFGRIGTPVFASGFTGWGFEIDFNRSSAEMDYLTVRKSMRVFELVINQLRGSNGSIVVSDFNKLKEVEDKGSVWRCIIDDYDGEMYMNMRAGDMVRCQVFTGNNIKYYVGKVTAVGNEWFEIDKKMLDGIDVPEPGDVLCRWNSFTDTDRQGLIYLTSSDSHAPYIDILDGGTELTDFERLRARIGRLTGVHDPAFPAMRKYGIYTDSFYGKGELILHSSGMSVTTMLAAVDGRITAEVSEIKSLLPVSLDNILKNSSFSTDTAYWSYSNQGVQAYTSGGQLFFVSGNLFLLKDKATEIIFDESSGRRVLKIIDNRLTQFESNYNKLNVEKDVKFELNFTYKITKPGIFTIGIQGTELFVSESKEESNWKTEVLVGNWNQSGDFQLKIEGGEALVYNISVKVSDKAYLIGLIEELKAGLQITAEEAKLYADAKYIDLYGRVTSEYNAAISVSAQNINLSITAVQNNLSQFKSQTETSINLINGQIALKVNKTDFDALGNRVSTAESSITQLSSQIALKVNKTDFDTLFGRVTTAESNITLLSNRIDVKVSQTDYDAYKNLVSQTYATTVWTNSQISNYVLKADYNGATVASLINQSPDSVKIFANKVEIRAGEYNSVKDSEFLTTTPIGLSGNTYYNSIIQIANPFNVTKNLRLYQIPTSSTASYQFRFNNVITKSGTYTFSAYIRTSKACRVIMDVADNSGVAIDLQANV